MAEEGDETELLVDTTVDFPATGRVMHVTVRLVPVSEAYPDGLKYSMHYGDYEGTTIVRYDNAHGVHERHAGEAVEEITFPGWRELLDRFRREVLEHEREHGD